MSKQLYAEMVESVYHHVLEQLQGADDDDVVRAQIVLEQWLEEIRSFQQPRPAVIAALEQAIADEWTVGELRRRIRAGIADIARGGA
jgi:hypothetical protein